MKDITEILKNVFDIAQACFTIAALIVGGIWTYLLFVRRRQHYPRAKLIHTVTHKSITEDKVLLHVAVTISNTGDLLLSFVEGTISVLQLLPLWHEIRNTIDKGHDPIPDGETEIIWPSPKGVRPRKMTWPKGELEIEPGDSQDIHCDFILNADVQIIEVYSHFSNIKKRKIGWNLTTIYDLRSDQED